MSIPLTTLQALASVNPYRWADLSQDELDKRIAQADLRELIFRPRIPGVGPFGHIGTGKTLVTKAVLAHVAKVDPVLYQVLNDVHQSAREPDNERLMFEWLELAVRQRISEERREGLSRVAQAVRHADDVDDRRAM